MIRREEEAVEEDAFTEHFTGIVCAGQEEDIGQVAAVWIAAAGADDDKLNLFERFAHKVAGALAGGVVKLRRIDTAQMEALGAPGVKTLVDAHQDRIAIDDPFGNGDDGVEFAALNAVDGKAVG